MYSLHLKELYLWLDPIHLNQCADNIYRPGAALDDIFGFTNGTLRSCTLAR